MDSTNQKTKALALIFHTKLKIVECVCGNMVYKEHVCDKDITEKVVLNYTFCQGDQCFKCADELLINKVDSKDLFTEKNDICMENVSQDCLKFTLHQELKLTETCEAETFFYQNPYRSQKLHYVCPITQYRKLFFFNGIGKVGEGGHQKSHRISS